MSELDHAPEAPERPRDTLSRLLSVTALLVSLLAAGGSGYVVYRYMFASDTAPQSNDLAEVRAALTEALSRSDDRDRKLDQRILAVENALADRPGATADAPDRPPVDLDARFEAERSRIDKSLETLKSALGTALLAQPPTTSEWKLAEAEYLLRIGNHRVSMEHDARGAVAMFRAADEVIRDLDDVGLLPVRAALAEEIPALESVSRLDVDGAFVRIEALKKRIGELPLRLPEYKAQAGTPADEGPPSPASEPADEGAPQPSVLEKLGERLSRLIRIRQHSSEGLMPLLDPTQAGYLEMNLELALDRAQLALLRDDATLYDTSLDSARRLLDQHLDATSQPVITFRAELDGLDELELGAPLPDVSRSLRLLRAVPRVTPGHEPPAPEDAS